MERKALEQSEHLKGDCFTIRCDIVIADPLAPFIRVPPSNMCRHFTELLETMVGTDVTVMVGGEAFAAHRCVLAARSIVFLDDLFRRRKEGTRDDVIEIEYMEASVFKALLHFIYTDSFPKMEEVPNGMKVEGEVEDDGAESMWLQRLLAAADRYNLQRLKSMCQEKLAKHINLSSVMTLLVLAVEF
jgi:speckle-type POZ protein